MAFPGTHEDNPVVHIPAGKRFNVAVMRDGAMYTWGEGAQGEVGIANQEHVQTPTVHYLVPHTVGTPASLCSAVWDSMRE